MNDTEQAAPSEATVTGTPCEHCHGPVTAPKRKRLVKRFCSDRCRANHRDQKIDRAVQHLHDVADETQAEMDRLQAKLNAALAMLAEAVGTRQALKRKKDKKVVDTVLPVQ